MLVSLLREDCRTSVPRGLGPAAADLAGWDRALDCRQDIGRSLTGVFLFGQLLLCCFHVNSRSCSVAASDLTDSCVV